MLAHHYVSALEYLRASGEPTESLVEPARRAFEAAGQRAYALHAWRAAARYYRHALELTTSDDPARPRLLVGLGRSLRAVDDPEQVSVLEEAAALGPKASEEAAVAEALLANLAWYRGRRDDAVRR